MVNEPCFVTPQGCFADLPQKKLTVFEKHPSILRTSDLPSRVDFLLGTEVDHYSRKSIGSKHWTDHLFSCPKDSWLEDSGRREVDEFIGICEPGEDLRELLSCEENISGSDEEGSSEKILD